MVDFGRFVYFLTHLRGKKVESKSSWCPSSDSCSTISIIRPVEIDIEDSPISSCIPNWWNVSEIELCKSWYLTLALREVDGLEVDIFSSSVKSPIDLLVLLRDGVFEDWKVEISSSSINLGIDLFLL